MTVQLNSDAKRLIERQLESLLLERVEDNRPGTELTPQFKEQFREQVRQRRQSCGSMSFLVR